MSANPAKAEERPKEQQSEEVIRTTTASSQSAEEQSAMGYNTLVLLGEYLIPEVTNIRSVLDIGANVGAFAMWARQMWPECELDCYEPMPEAFECLRHNVSKLNGVRGHRYAVTNVENPVMRRGVNTSGEDSIHDLGCQSEPTVAVRTIKPCDLPRAEFVKIDAEGCEVEIVLGILPVWKPKAFALEWHSYADRVKLRNVLRGAGYTVAEHPNAIVSISKNQHIGILKAWR